MAENGQILEGVFAISKPPFLSSAQVLRDLQTKFRESSTFKPLLASTREGEGHQSKKRRRNNDSPFKMGHGGTLDPMATGVLIVGIGRGTKHLQNFLECTKQYDTTVLFGKSTTTYDIAGDIVAEAPYDGITRSAVEDKLAQFRGKIKQTPPIYSALKIDGMKAYDYARSGKELPRQLESREMTVTMCTLLDFQEGGSHDFRWPTQHADETEKIAARKLMNASGLDVEGGVADAPATTSEAAGKSIPPLLDEAASPGPSKKQLNEVPAAEKAAQHTHKIMNLSDTPSPAPAAAIKLVVSSGFYVRSFAHDLGIALSSYGVMASLVRSRQGEYVLDNNPDGGLVRCLTYEDLEKGEEHWGPLITSTLTTWMDKNPVLDLQDRIENRDRGRDRWHNKHRHGGRGQHAWQRKRNQQGEKRERSPS